MTSKLWMTVLVLLALTSVCAAQGTAEKVEAQEAGKLALLTEESAAIKADLDSDAYQLPSNIGEMIDDARMSGNPAESWSVISALHFAEEHSGNTSGLVTAKVLFDEAVEKAVRNQDSLALLMAARLANASGDADLAAELMAQSEAAASAAEGEKAGPYTFDLEVNNYWDEPVDVYIDDWYIDTVPINHYVYYSDLPVGYYYLYAYGLWTGGYTVVDVVGTSYGFVSVDLVY